MSSLFLAQTNVDGWTVVQAVSVMVSLGVASLAFIRSASGKSGERQIEPTQIANLSAQISGVAKDLGAINRELGEVRAIGERTEDAVGVLSSKQHDDMSGVHKRIDAISDRVSAHDARIHAIERSRA